MADILEEELRQILFKEIDLIQGCLERMARNSFLLKGWTITVMAVIFGLMPTTSGIIVPAILFLGILFAFWYLDAYFLKLERCYRYKYEWIVSNRLSGKLDHLFDLDPHNHSTWIEGQEKHSVPGLMCSGTLAHFYGFILLVMIAIVTCEIFF